MIEVPSRISMGKVFMNSLHALTSFDIRNISEKKLFVKLRSNLENENLRDKSSTTNTVSASETANTRVHFNQIFNFVNYIQNLTLEAGETKSVVVAFLPAAVDPKEEEIFDFKEGNGMIFLLCFMDSAETPTTPAFQTAIKFRSLVCQSVLAVDVSSAGIIFDDCVVGERYSREFKITNKSEIDLFWSLNTEDLRKSFSFEDADSGLPLTISSIGTYSAKIVRIVFTPVVVGEFDYDLFIENLNNSSNSVQIHIHTFVRSTVRDERLIIKPGLNIDFGDCCGGIMKKKNILLKNVGDSPLEVCFATDNPNDIVFQLHSDELVEEKGHHKRVSICEQEPTSSDEGSLSQSYSTGKPNSLAESKESISDSLSVGNSAISLGRSRSSSSIESSVESLESAIYRSSIFDQGLFEEHRGKEIKQDSNKRIEELMLRPGSAKTIEVCYLPPKEPVTADFRAGTLSKRLFKIFLKYSSPGKSNISEKVTLQCVANSCTSYITISPEKIDFGDADVGAVKTSSFDILNKSDLPAVCELRFESKVLTARRGEILIPPRQQVEIKLDLYPRKVNPDYHKLVTIVNLLNSDNDQILSVSSTNVDKQRVTLHSLFYNIYTPQSTHFVDFGLSSVNSAVVRSLSIENITNKPLLLELKSSIPENLKIFENHSENEAPRSKDYRMQIIQNFEKEIASPLINGTSAIPKTISHNELAKKDSVRAAEYNSSPVSEYLDLASPVTKELELRKSRKRALSGGRRLYGDINEMEKRPSTVNSQDLSEISEYISSSNEEMIAPENWQGEELPLNELLALAEQRTGQPVPLVFKDDTEEGYVSMQKRIRRELATRISSQDLLPVSLISIDARQKVQIYLFLYVTNPSKDYTRAKPKKLDGSINIRMMKFDEDVLKDVKLNAWEENPLIPVRELMVRSFICQSVMGLGQRNINFGNLDKNDRRLKRIIINNKSEIPLLYSIKKSGSIASGDLVFSAGKEGIVRGYSKREVEFVFHPSLTGTFQEKLTIENVLNPENDQALIIKSHIRQPANFSLETPLIEIGPYNLQQSPIKFRTISVGNGSKHVRVFEVRVDPLELKFPDFTCEIWFTIDTDREGESGVKFILSKETVEKIEQLEQKLKIAVRKGREDKAVKIREHLQILRAGKEESIFHHEDYLNTPALGEVSSSANSDPQKIKATESSIIFPINSREVKSIKIFFRAKANLHDSGDLKFPNLPHINIPKNTPLPCDLKIYINELKNTDIVKKAILKATICKTITCYEHCKEIQKNNPIQSPKNDADELDMELTDHDVISSPIKEKHLNSLQVEMNVIDLGRLELNESHECYFNLSSTTNLPVSYLVSVNAMSKEMVGIFQNSGMVFPRQQKRVTLTIKPRITGRSFVSLQLKSSDSSDEIITIKFIFFTVLSNYLEFTKVGGYDYDLVRGAGKKDFNLDMQYCFVDSNKNYAKVVPLRLKNVTKTSCYISAFPNLAQQCQLFLDRALTKPMGSDCILAPRGAALLIYIALQPILNEIGGKGLDKGYFGGRSLVGGIIFSAYVVDRPEQSHLILSEKVTIDSSKRILAQTHKLKLVSIVGKSSMEVENVSIDFGTNLRIGQQEKGQFLVKNISKTLPLNFDLTTESKLLKIDKKQRKISPVEEDDTLEHIEAIPFTFKCERYGYFNETIICRNLNNSAQSITLRVRGFVDPSIVEFTDPALKECNELSLLNWENLYAIEVANDPLSNFRIQSRTKSDVAQTNEKSILVTNTSNEAMRIESLCNMKSHARWVIGSGAGFVYDKAKIDSESNYLGEFSRCGPIIYLGARQKALLSISAPEFAPNIVQQHLLKYNSFCVDGVFLLRSVDSDIDLKALNLKARYCVSFGTIEPAYFDIGKIGNENNWKDVKITFTITNTSKIQLHYEIELDDCLSVESIKSDGQEQTRNCINIDGSHILEVALKPRKFSGTVTGPHVAKVKFINLCNSSNCVEIPINYVVTHFELEFSRLEKGELILPPLRHPSLQDRSSCDNWFTIGNKSGKEVKFEFGVTLSPDVVDLLEIEVLSRASNGKLTSPVTLSPAGTLEVKVRATPLDLVRLSAVTINSNSKNSVTCGAFWVNTFGGTELDIQQFQVRETIPIRGTLVDQSICSLSTSELVFFTSYLGDSDEEENEEQPTPVQIEAQVGYIVLHNNSAKFNLRLQGRFKFPAEYSGPPGSKLFHIAIADSEKPLELTEEGIFFMNIVPESMLKLAIVLKESSIYGLSDDIQILFIDLESVERIPQSVTLKLREPARKLKKIDESRGYTAELVISDLDENGTSFKSHLLARGDTRNSAISASEVESCKDGVFDVKGCKKRNSVLSKRFPGLFYLELGSHETSSIPLVKKLSIELREGAECHYKVESSAFSDALSFNRTEGVLSQQAPLASLLITISLSNVGNFIFFVTILNVENPSDTSYIRINLDVFAKSNFKKVTPAQSEILFDKTIPKGIFEMVPFVNMSENTFNVGSRVIGEWYSERFVLIRNLDSVPLTMNLIAVIPENDKSEIIFSLFAGQIRMDDCFTVAPFGELRIYINYSLYPADEEVKEFEIKLEIRNIAGAGGIFKLVGKCELPTFRLSPRTFNLPVQIESTPKDQILTFNSFSNEFSTFAMISESPFLIIEPINFGSKNFLKQFDFNSFWLKEPLDDISAKELLPTYYQFNVARGNMVKFKISVNIPLFKKHLSLGSAAKYKTEFLVFMDKTTKRFQRVDVKIFGGKIHHFETNSISSTQFNSLECNCFHFLNHNISNSSHNLGISSDLLRYIIYLFQYFYDMQMDNDATKAMFGFFLKFIKLTSALKMIDLKDNFVESLSHFSFDENLFLQ